MGDFTSEQVERAAEELWKQTAVGEGGDWLGECSERWKSMFRAKAYAVLSVAGAPEKVAPVRIDPSELAALIYSIEYGTDPDSAEPGDIEDRLGMADELIEWFAEKHIPVVDEVAE